MQLVHGPYVVIIRNWTPIFKWYMARLVGKNGHQKDMCYNEIGLCAQNKDIIVGFAANISGRVAYVIA